MFVITGAAGFIGSALGSSLYEKEKVVLVDDFSPVAKEANWHRFSKALRIEREEFANWMQENGPAIKGVYHLGARTDTAEFDWEVLKHLNLDYSKMIWNSCTQFQIPLVYASSAATYGMGEHGFEDAHELVDQLQPLNPYGRSKNDFDSWVLKQKDHPPRWYGVKFFNVFGPNEYHKGRMASVILHAYRQILETGKMKLFRSHHPDFKDGEQKRDFIYVKEVVGMCCHLMNKQISSGLYNMGMGKAHTFRQLVQAVFKALELDEKIEFINTPEDIRDKYQYYTQAEMQKLFSSGYELKYPDFDAAVLEYVQDYLRENHYL